jgi:transcriptional regulator with XRE-family HTH domain
MIYKDLGAKIRKERIRLHLTQEKLADDLDVSTAYIGQVERGERGLTLEKLIALVNRLGITVDYLLSDSVPIQNKAMYDIWSHLMEGKTEKERSLAINLVKLVFDYIDSNVINTIEKEDKKQSPNKKSFKKRL